MSASDSSAHAGATRGPSDDGPLADIGEALEAFARGEILVVVDDEDRENEGDLIMAAEHVTPEKIVFPPPHLRIHLCSHHLGAGR